MKQLLLFLMLVLTLSSCTTNKDNYTYLASGTIESIDKNNTIFVEDVGYPLKGGVEDYYLNEELKVGDKVNIYSYKGKLLATKIDGSYIPNLQQWISPISSFSKTSVFAILTVIGIIGFAICGSLLNIYKTFTILRYPLLTLSGIIGISSFVIYLLTPNIEYKGTVTFDEKTLTDDRAIIENIAYPASNVYYKKVVKQNCFVYQAEDEIFLINQDEITGEHPELLAPAVNQKTAKNLKLTMIICVIVFVLSLKSFYKMMKFVNNKFSLWASKLTFKRKKTYIKEEVNSSGGLGSFVHE